MRVQHYRSLKSKYLLNFAARRCLRDPWMHVSSRAYIHRGLWHGVRITGCIRALCLQEAERPLRSSWGMLCTGNNAWGSARESWHVCNGAFGSRITVESTSWQGLTMGSILSTTCLHCGARKLPDTHRVGYGCGLSRRQNLGTVHPSLLAKWSRRWPRAFVPISSPQCRRDSGNGSAVEPLIRSDNLI
jgi:hypothetical protein